MENFCQALGNVVQHTANAMQGLRFPLVSPSFCFGLQERRGEEARLDGNLAARVCTLCS